VKLLISIGVMTMLLVVVPPSLTVTIFNWVPDTKLFIFKLQLILLWNNYTVNCGIIYFRGFIKKNTQKNTF